MKIGMRKPSLKRSIKARTTGRAKRAVKRALIPGYGKKGAGWIKNPKRAAYNKVYNKTTFGVGDIARAASGTKKRSHAKTSGSRSTTTAVAGGAGSNFARGTLPGSITTVGRANVTLVLCVLLGYFGIHRFYAKKYVSGLVYLLTLGLCGVGWIYDILTLLGRRSELVRGAAASDPVEALDVKITVCGPDGKPIDFDSEEHRERMALLEEENEKRRRESELNQRNNREFLAASGVDVDSFTPTKAIADALSVIDGCCPSMARFDRGLTKTKPTITFCSPTKTGRVPKNVVEASIVYDEFVERPVGVGDITASVREDSLSVRISYLSNGMVNKADLHGWHNRRGVGVSVRRSKDGSLVVTGAEKINFDGDGNWQAACTKKDPTAQDIKDALDKAVNEVYAPGR